ncbi:MAG: hypothetical protein MUP63_03255 [Candidatus Nanohaloarchaeota archaeon QJJ-7]|nr:hypothetical protein [Candidatus Nanohaloarchaeota archaeon QJJ-7]
MVSGIGLLGSALLPVAWLLETYRTYEARDLEAVDPKFVALYVLGSALLAYHAFQIQDLPFIVLNVTMVMFTGTELALLLHVKRGDNGES